MAEEERRPEQEVTVERTSGSVYQALGLPDADEMEQKARLAMAIGETITAKGLTQSQAAKRVGLDQPTLSKLLRGRFRSVTLDKLASMLNALGRDVTIVVGALPERDDVRGRTHVALS